jgi:hypothetical protein
MLMPASDSKPTTNSTGFPSVDDDLPPVFGCEILARFCSSISKPCKGWLKGPRFPVGKWERRTVFTDLR